MSAVPTPARGEIWLINFDPSVGSEIQKVRPAVVVSMDNVGRLPLKIVAPLTDWKPPFHALPWFTIIPANRTNGLMKDSGADAFQTKSVSLSRFVDFLGTIDPVEMDAIAESIALCVGAP